MLTGKQRAYLRGLANDMQPIFQIGKNGIEETFLKQVEEALEKGEKVQLVGFGTFETRERAAREGRNPRTKEVIKIAASTVPVFKAGKEFKEKVNK